MEQIRNRAVGKHVKHHRGSEGRRLDTPAEAFRLRVRNETLNLARMRPERIDAWAEVVVALHDIPSGGSHGVSEASGGPA